MTDTKTPASATDDTIRDYWDRRARDEGGCRTATTNDVFLRELEIRTCVRTLRALGVSEGDTFLDVGCGDGYSTLAVLAALPGIRAIGVDYSPAMIQLAALAAEGREELKGRAEFRVGDALALQASLGAVTYPFVVTMRCLINLNSAAAQGAALREVAARLSPGGHYLAFENFLEGQEEMNRARTAMGLEPIPVRWHNRYFSEDEFRRLAEPLFDSIRFDEFASSYYFATRVIYSAMCRMRNERPDYHHDIHRLAVDLPPVGGFSPVRQVTLRKRQAP